MTWDVQTRDPLDQENLHEVADIDPPGEGP